MRWTSYTTIKKYNRMKRIVASSFFLLFLIFNLNAQTEKEIKTQIRHVTVFPDRAQIENETSVTLSPGTTILKFTGLSPYIDIQSIQVKGFGEFTIMSVNHQNNYLENLEDTPEVKSIRSQIEALQIKIEDEKVAISTLKEKEAFLVENRAILVKATNFSIEQLKTVMELYTNNMEQVKMTTLKKNRLINDYEKQIAALQQQISKKAGKPQLPSGEISVTVTAEKQLSGKLTMSYVVSNAGWYPTYDIRVDDINKPVSIYYKANVYQNTGVAWKDVKLSFSNATPWVSGDIPEIYPWYIDYYNPSPIRLRGMVSGAKRSEAPSAMALNEVVTDERIESDGISSGSC